MQLKEIQMKLKVNDKQKKRIQKLINALRSGRYKKTVGQMKHSNMFCFYGVACEIYRINTKNGSKWVDEYLEGGKPYFDDGNDCTAFGPTKKVNNYYGWVGWIGKVMPGTKNDEGWSFKRLANLLERAIS